MPSPKSLLRVAGITFGSIGVVICIAAMILLWMASVRLGRVAENMFSKMSGSLDIVRERVIQTQGRVAAAKITAEDIEAALQNWTRQEVAQRIALQLNAREKSERLGSALQQADDWLAVAESSGERIQDLLSINTSMNETGDTTLFDQLIAEIRSLRTQLATATEIVSTVHDRISKTSDEASPEARFEQAARFTVRVVVTLGSINSRFDSIASRVTVAQRRLQELKTSTQWWILVATIGVTLLMLLMAAGQIALCYLAWDRWR